MLASSTPSRSGLLDATLLALSVAGCVAPSEIASRGQGATERFHAADVAALSGAALEHYDVTLLGALVNSELADLSGSNAPPERERLEQLARLGHRLADTLKFEATCLPDGEARELLVVARLDVAEDVLDFLEPALARDPDNAALAFAVGELLAFRIDGLLSGMALGERSRETLERAAMLGAGTEPGTDAELALARRFYYLPSFAGGDMARAEAALLEVLERHPDHEPSWAFLGEVRHLRGDADGARSALERARELNPYNPRARVLLSQPHLELVP